jgi:hypothetical protein
VAKRLRADHPGGGPGFQHAHALAFGLLRLVKAAGRLNDQQRAGKTRRRGVRLNLPDVALHPRADIGIGNHGRAALELAIFLRQLVRCRYEHLRVLGFDDLFGARFVLGVAIAIEEQHGRRLDAERAEPPGERGQLGLVERTFHFAVRQHPLLDLEAKRALDQRHVFLEVEIIGVRPIDPPDLIDVTKALGDDERRAGAGALQDRVDRDRRAV